SHFRPRPGSRRRPPSTSSGGSAGPVEPPRLPVERCVDQILQRATGEELVERPPCGGVADDQDPTPFEPHQVADEAAEPLDHVPVALAAGVRQRDESRTRGELRRWRAVQLAVVALPEAWV